MHETERVQTEYAIVTGGGQGIGQSIATTLGYRGVPVAVFDSDSQRGPGTVNTIIGAGGSAVFVEVDVSSPDSVATGVEAASEMYGQPRYLVNNAGIYPRSEAIDMDVEMWNRVLSVNLSGAFLCSQSVARQMGDGGGAIVNIGSRAGLEGEPNGAHYSASKAGIIGLTKALAHEWAPRIRVNCVVPGLTNTSQPLGDPTIRSADELVGKGTEIPMGRIGEPQDVADAVDFLLSDRASFITGQTLCVNGGRVMH